MDDRQKLVAYFDEVDVVHERLHATKDTDARLRVLAKQLVPRRRRNAARMAATNAVRVVQRRKAAHLEVLLV